MRATHPVHTQKVTPRPPRFDRMPVAGSRGASAWAPAPRGAAIAVDENESDSSATWEGSSGTAHPRVQDGEEEVDGEVHDHERYGSHQGHALNHQVIVAVDGVDQLEPDARELEEDLDHERAGEQGADADARSRQQRERRRAQHMTEQDVARRQPLGP